MIKNILLHCRDDGRNRERANLATGLARDQEAHLTGLYVQRMPGVVGGYPGLYIGGEVLNGQRHAEESAARACEEEFTDIMGKQDVPYEWRAEEGEAWRVIARHARYADLTVIGQLDREKLAKGSYVTLAEDAVMVAGGPVLVIPYVGQFSAVGRTVLVAWNSSREAVRAVHDALPILTGAERVVVLSVNADTEDHIPGADICTHLARHGVAAEAMHTVAKNIDVGDVLLSSAADLGADLLVMGAYGHSRFREIALGGVTRHLLNYMTLPVLISH